MSTLLDQILQERGFTASGALGVCKSHKASCTCHVCNEKKSQSPGTHKNWKQRRNKRLNVKTNPGPGVPARRSNTELENEWEAGSGTAGAHVILVAGHNWESPSHKFITYCFNRCKRLLKKDKNLRFTVFDFSSGKVITGKLVGSKLDWVLLKQYAAITPSHYSKTGKHYVFKGDPDVMSVLHVYKYIINIGATEPGSVAELSFFAHGWMGGPILVNSYDSFTKENDRPERDPADKDPRTFKDFEVANMPDADLDNFRKAFAAESFTWVWGCAFASSFFQVLHRVLKNQVYRSAYPKAIPDAAQFSFSFEPGHASSFFQNDDTFFPAMDATGKFPLQFKRTFLEIKEFLTRGRWRSYANALAVAAAVPCRSAFLGTYADYEKNVLLPLMLIPRKVPPYSDNFSAYVNFYKKYMMISEDPESRGYGVFLP